MTITEDVKLYLRSKNGPEGFRPAEPNESVFFKPTVLCCGGTLCGHANMSKANGFAKKAEAMLNVIDLDSVSKPYQIASVTYANACLIGENIKAFNNGQTDPAMFESFVDKQLVPLFTTEDNQRRTLEETKKNFRNIQVLAHSFGGIFMQQVGNLLVDKMQKIGFSQKEIDEVTKQVVIVTSGCAADINKGKAKFTTLHILNFRDQVVTNYTSNIGIARHLKSLREQDDDPLAAIPYIYNVAQRSFDVDNNSNQILLTTTPCEADSPTALRLNDSKNGYSRVSHEDEMLYENTDDTYHEAETYYDYSFTNNGMMLRLAAAHVLNAALNNSVQNSWLENQMTPLPTLTEMLAPSEVGFKTEAGQRVSFSNRVASNKFGFDAENDFSFVANCIGYKERMHNALNAIHREPPQTTI